MMKVTRFFLCVFMCLSTLPACKSNKPPLDELINRCKKIQVGMTMQQVVEIMGPPEEKSYAREDTLIVEYWYYATDPTISAPIRCDFDSTTSRIIAVECEE